MRTGFDGIDQAAQKKLVLTPEAILRYLINDDDELDKLIICKGEQLSLTATDLAVYEAMGSLKSYDNFRLNKLVKLFQVVDIQSSGSRKDILKENRVEELRKLALKK